MNINGKIIDLEATSKLGAFSNPKIFQDLKLADCYLSAIGGRVISQNFKPTTEQIREIILETIGEGSILTFGNPKARSRKEYALKAFADGHLWSLRTLDLSFLFVDAPEAFRNDIAYCRRFHMSWQEKVTEGIPLIFTAQGSLRDWKKFLTHNKDKSFSFETRDWMSKTKQIIDLFIPELFE